MTVRRLPSADELTYAQHQGWACVWCGASLRTSLGGVSVGRAQGDHGFSIEVYACPGPIGCTPHRPDSPAATNAPPAGGLRASGGMGDTTPPRGWVPGQVGPRGGAATRTANHTVEETGR